MMKYMLTLDSPCGFLEDVYLIELPQNCDPNRSSADLVPSQLYAFEHTNRVYKSKWVTQWMNMVQLQKISKKDHCWMISGVAIDDQWRYRIQLKNNGGLPLLSLRITNGCNHPGVTIIRPWPDTFLRKIQEYFHPKHGGHFRRKRQPRYARWNDSSLAPFQAPAKQVRSGVTYCWWFRNPANQLDM